MMLLANPGQYLQGTETMHIRILGAAASLLLLSGCATHSMQDQLDLRYQKALGEAQAAQAKIITACDPTGREKWLVDSTCFGAKLNALSAGLSYQAVRQ